MNLKIPSAKWRPYYLGLNVFIKEPPLAVGSEILSNMHCISLTNTTNMEQFTFAAFCGMKWRIHAHICALRKFSQFTVRDGILHDSLNCINTLIQMVFLDAWNILINIFGWYFSQVYLRIICEIALVWLPITVTSLWARKRLKSPASPCLLNRLFRHRSKKHQSFASLAFVWGIHRGPMNSPHKWPVTRKKFLFDDVIMQ